MHIQTEISVASRALAEAHSTTEEPRYVSMAKENVGKKDKLEQALREKEELELSRCPFKPSMPSMSDPKWSHVQPKFMDALPQRREKEASPVQTAAPGVSSPTTPRKKQSPLSPGRDTSMPSPIEAHLARAQTARDMAADRESRLLRPINQAQWLHHRETTKAVPFASHTDMRKKQRDYQKQCEKLDKVSDQLFKDLHEKLHSLDFGGPAW